MNIRRRSKASTTYNYVGYKRKWRDDYYIKLVSRFEQLQKPDFLKKI